MNVDTVQLYDEQGAKSIASKLKTQSSIFKICTHIILFSMNSSYKTPLRPTDEDDGAKVIEEMIEPFLRWAEKEKLRSYDWWDIWGTAYGGWGKQLYFKNKFLGVMAVAPLVLLDFVYPSFRKYFVSKRAFPISHAHIATGYLNLFQVTDDEQYLEKAIALADELLQMAAPNTSGLGWGMKHKWMTLRGLIPTDTPCNTQTVYVYELFAQLHAVTGNEKYQNHLQEILTHVANDFPEWQEGDKLVCSYSTLDTRRVVNANSYRMFMLIEGGKRFRNPVYVEKGLATLRYVLSRQNADGSWPYSEEENFVDCYHTVFVIKNLGKVKNLLEQEDVKLNKALETGMHYYFTRLYDDKGWPKPFAVQPRLTLFKYDSYDFAESIGLLADINSNPPLLKRLVRFVKDNFQTKAGWFLFRIYRLLPINGIPYMRYANSNMFLALTKALKNYKQHDSKNQQKTAQRSGQPYQTA